jgi:hypothetical protein
MRTRYYDWLRNRDPLQILVLTVGLYVLSQLWAQMAMEIQFPYAIKLGPITAVLFLS